MKRQFLRVALAARIELGLHDRAVEILHEYRAIGDAAGADINIGKAECPQYLLALHVAKQDLPLEALR